MKRIYIVIIVIMLFFSSCSAGKKADPITSAIDEEYEIILSDTSLSNAELSERLYSLSLQWESEAQKAYDDLLNTFHEGGKQIALVEYWNSRNETERLEITLSESLVTQKYGSGSIGAVELAKIEYQIKKGKALEICNIYNYLNDAFVPVLEPI